MHVLYLEDDTTYVELINSILGEAGHSVHSVGNGHEAIRHLERTVVDLLILDWEVPGLSGFEVLKWARERIGGTLPILFLTIRAHENEIFSAINAGARRLHDQADQSFRIAGAHQRIAAPGLSGPRYPAGRAGHRHLPDRYEGA
ncbi:CheY-like chemotaxis protein [Burkholderia ambifaria]